MYKDYYCMSQWGIGECLNEQIERQRSLWEISSAGLVKELKCNLQTLLLRQVKDYHICVTYPIKETTNS